MDEALLMLSGLFKPNSQPPQHDHQAHKNKTKFDIDHLIPTTRTFEDLASHLHDVFAYDTVNIDYVTKVLENFTPNRKEWQKYAIYDRYK
jgi:hypothetical protein